MKQFLPVLALVLFLPSILPAQNADDQAQRNAALVRRQHVGRAWIPPRAAIMRNGKHWVGPAYRDRDLQLARPWATGRFTRGIGAEYVWALEGGTRERFSLGGAWFSLASADSLRASDWRWDMDHVVMYPDPAHDGWYRAYNVRLEEYVHVKFLGLDSPQNVAVTR